MRITKPMGTNKKNEKDSKYWLKNNKKNLRTNKVYGGCKAYSPSGNLMFLGVEKKVDWYLDRTDKDTGLPLAVEIRHINPILNFIMKLLFIKPRRKKIQLTFEPKDEGNKNDNYSLSKKKNRCVVTGDKDLELLTKHHITPYCYRMFMPDEYKSANSHDVVPITSEKHYEYERHADNLKEKIANMYNAPLHGKKDVDHKLFYAIKSARALVKYADVMSKEKSELHKKAIRLYTNQKKVTQKILLKLTSTEFDEASRVKAHGEIVIEKLLLEGDEAMQEFVEMWREHFLLYAKPKYMPKHWDPKRPASRLK